MPINRVPYTLLLEADFESSQCTFGTIVRLYNCMGGATLGRTGMAELHLTARVNESLIPIMLSYIHVLEYCSPGGPGSSQRVPAQTIRIKKISMMY